MGYDYQILQRLNDIATKMDQFSPRIKDYSGPLQTIIDQTDGLGDSLTKIFVALLCGILAILFIKLITPRWI